jgi:hypothetical protein
MLHLSSFITADAKKEEGKVESYWHESIGVSKRGFSEKTEETPFNPLSMNT